MVRGSCFVARGLWLVVCGSWFVARGLWLPTANNGNGLFATGQAWIVVRGSWIVGRGSWFVDRGSHLTSRIHFSDEVEALELEERFV